MYTEEQLMVAFNYGKTLEPFDSFGDMVNSLKPIEIPHPDDILTHIQNDDLSEYDDSFHDGAKWIINKIQRG